ncbi:MAG: hypothetical protein ABEN55_12410 [Bradymonadaceae bacterium]
MLAQICLPLNYEAEQNSTGLTAWAGLPVFLALMTTAGLPAELMDKVGLRPDQGWSDIQQVATLVLLKLAGGDCITDGEQMEADDGLVCHRRGARGPSSARGDSPKARQSYASRWREDVSVADGDSGVSGGI